MRRLLLVLVVPLLAVACSDEEGSDNVLPVPPTTAGSTAASSETTVFDGSTSPTSAPGTATQVALLTDVRVEHGLVTFTFRDDQVPGFDAGYVEPPITQDASGEPMDVAGDTFLQIRMEPASGVDLGSDSEQGYEETYTGPGRIEGDAPIAEVARSGDFEANLTWVIGLSGAEQHAYRVEAGSSAIRVYISR